MDEREVGQDLPGVPVVLLASIRDLTTSVAELTGEIRVTKHWKSRLYKVFVAGAVLTLIVWGFAFWGVYQNHSTGERLSAVAACVTVRERALTALELSLANTSVAKHRAERLAFVREEKGGCRGGPDVP